MTVDVTSADDAGLCGPNRVRTIVQGLLRAAQASGWTDDALSAASLVPARTIKSYRVEGKEPSLSNALSIGLVLGKPAINSILALIGYGGACPLDEGDERKPIQMLANGMQHWAVIARNAADNRIDHTEEAETQLAADGIIAELIPYSSAGKAA